MTAVGGCAVTCRESSHFLQSECTETFRHTLSVEDLLSYISRLFLFCFCLWFFNKLVMKLDGLKGSCVYVTAVQLRVIMCPAAHDSATSVGQ